MLTSKIFNFFNTLKLRIAVGVLSCGLIILLSYAFDISNLYKSLQIVTTQETNSKYRLQQLHANSQPLPQQKITSPNVIRPNVVTPPLWCNQFAINELLSVIAKIIKDKQLDLQMIQSMTTQNINGFSIYPLCLSITGEYKNLIAFITTLLQLNVYILIPAYKMYIANNNLTLESTLFVYQNNLCTLPRLTKIEAPNQAIRKLQFIHNPFSAEETTYLQQNLNLSQWDSTSLSFVGMISEHNQNIAIIEDPVGIIYHVTVGDKIGTKQARIQKITANAILTSDVTQDIYWRN